MSDLRSVRVRVPAERRRPAIGEIRRLSGAGLIAVTGVAVLLLGLGLFELVHLLVSRVFDSPTTPRLIPAAVESLIRATQLM